MGLFAYDRPLDTMSSMLSVSQSLATLGSGGHIPTPVAVFNCPPLSEEDISHSDWWQITVKKPLMDIGQL